MAVIVWLVWRSRVRYALKAAALSAAALIATPYAFAYDLAAIAVPVAFLAQDQIDRGLLRGEQTTLLALFAASLVVFAMAGKAPAGCADIARLAGPDPPPRASGWQWARFSKEEAWRNP